MKAEIQVYNDTLTPEQQAICNALAKEITSGLPRPDSKIWHRHPVWFLNDNPIVGYSPRKDGSINLMFWSGQSFDEPDLKPEGSFKAAEIRYTDVKQINKTQLKRWLEKAAKIQWDYKNIIKNKGALARIK